jgi:hypothetical protein
MVNLMTTSVSPQPFEQYCYHNKHRRNTVTSFANDVPQETRDNLLLEEASLCLLDLGSVTTVQVYA